MDADRVRAGVAADHQRGLAFISGSVGWRGRAAVDGGVHSAADGEQWRLLG